MARMEDVGHAEPYLPPPLIKEIKAQEESLGEEKYPGYFPDKMF